MLCFDVLTIVLVHILRHTAGRSISPAKLAQLCNGGCYHVESRAMNSDWQSVKAELSEDRFILILTALCPSVFDTGCLFAQTDRHNWQSGLAEFLCCSTQICICIYVVYEAIPLALFRFSAGAARRKDRKSRYIICSLLLSLTASYPPYLRCTIQFAWLNFM